MADTTRRGEMLRDGYRNGVPGYWLGDLFFPRMAGGETPPAPGEGDSPKGDDPPAGKDGKPFDAERAQRTIDQLRDEVKAGKSATKELTDAKARLKEIEDKDKSEVERLAGTAREASEKLTAAEHRARDLAIRLVVAETATTLGITGASVKAAVRLLDHGALEFDEDTGEPTNVEAALKALVKEYPMLATDGEKPPPAKGTPQTPKPQAGKQPTPEDTEQTRQRLIASGAYPRF
jgi:hypothetical protein